MLNNNANGKDGRRSDDGLGEREKPEVPAMGPVRPVDPVGRVDRGGAVTMSGVVPSPVALGAYIFRAPGSPLAIDSFATKIGRMPAVVMWYEQWGGWDHGRLRLTELQAVASRGAIPIITWDPWDPTQRLDQPAYRLARIARGDFDDYVDSWARKLADYGQPVYLRFGHEMNGDWYPWCAGVNGNTAADFVAAWRRIRRRFAKASAANVRFVWSPNIEFTQSTPLPRLYPGDAYVDWVGLDGYNWGASRRPAQWLDLEELFLPSYQRLLSITSKPIMIAETASAERGGDKAAWIRRAFLDQLPTSFPRVRAVVWFHEDKETDWRVSSSPEALAAFRDAASRPHLRGRLR